MEEIWKDITGYEGIYKISNYGNVLNVKKDKLRKPSSVIYRLISLSKNGKMTSFKCSRLVALAFIPNPENKRIVNHKDGNKKNDFVGNLEWNTDSENIAHSFDTGIRKKDGYFGVVFKFKKWHASVMRNKKTYSLGAYFDIEDAKNAVDKFKNGDMSIVKIGKGIHNKNKFKRTNEKILEIVNFSHQNTIRAASKHYNVSPTSIMIYRKWAKSLPAT